MNEYTVTFEIEVGLDDFVHDGIIDEDATDEELVDEALEIAFSAPAFDFVKDVDELEVGSVTRPNKSDDDLDWVYAPTHGNCVCDDPRADFTIDDASLGRATDEFEITIEAHCKQCGRPLHVMTWTPEAQWPRSELEGTEYENNWEK